VDGRYKEITLAKVKAKIEEMKRRAATEPDFGVRVGKARGLFRNPKEKEEFKKWKEMMEREALGGIESAGD